MPFYFQEHQAYYACDWADPRAPRCTVSTAVASPGSHPVELDRYCARHGESFRAAGWTVGTGQHRGKAYCRLHRDALLLRENRGEMRREVGARRPESAVSWFARPPILPPDPVPERLVGQGMVRPSISPDTAPVLPFSRP